MNVTHKITMDLTRPTNGNQINVVEGDKNSRIVNVHLYENFVSWRVPTNASVLIKWERESGVGGEYSQLSDGSSAWSAVGNILTITLSDESTEYSGNVKFSIVLTTGDSQISTFVIIANVHAVANGKEETNSGTASSDISKLQKQIGNLSDLETKNKSNLVMAINEVVANGSGSGGGTGTPGKDGGYYTPKVSQPTAVTMQMTFTPSRVDMPAVEPVTINLPVGEDSSQNGTVPDNVALLEDVTADEASSDFIPMLSPDGTEYRLSITDGGIPVIKNLSGATVWSGNSGGSTGGDSGGDSGEDSGGDTGGSDEVGWVSGAEIAYTVTADEYVDRGTGKFVSEPGGYDRTDYIYCYDAGAVYYDGVQTNYAAFYDINKQYISGFAIGGVNGNYANIPENAAYFAISASTLDNAVIKLYKKVEPTWTDGEAYEFTFVEGEYVENVNGTFTAYSGWKRTEYMNCVGASKMTKTNASANCQYGAFYNAEKEYMTSCPLPDTTSGAADITVPAGACYFIVSDTDANMDTLVLVPHA